VKSVKKSTDKSLLALTERRRVRAQAAFDDAVPGAERNRLGQFATPLPLADSMVATARALFPDCFPVRFLDPALGTGAFFSSVLNNYGRKGVASACGFEIDKRLASIAKRLWKPLGLDLQQTDFTIASPPRSEIEKANLIVCNPPYVRHHHLSAVAKETLKRLTAPMGFSVSGLMGLYGYYLLLADKWLVDNGAAIWIVPSELLDVNYGTVLKRYLTERVITIRIHRFDAADVQFNDALVTSVILCFRKTPPSTDSVIEFTAGGTLLRPSFKRSVMTSDVDAFDKWAKYFRKPELVKLTRDKTTLRDLFDIKRGLATGSNEFFIF
jgi:hypothetical protein